MLRYETWDKPEDWGIISPEEQDAWMELAKNLEQFYRNMRTHRHINTGLSKYATPDEVRSYQFLMKIFEDQNKIYDATNMLARISLSDGGSKPLVVKSDGMLTEKDLPYVFLSQFAWTLIQTYESVTNVIKITITTMNLKTKKGAPWPRDIEDTSLETLLDLLRKDSNEQITYIENIIYKNKEIRNAFSHGLFWYENERIFWIGNISSSEPNSIYFKEFINRLREQSLFTQCFLWSVGKLIQENLFEP